MDYRNLIEAELIVLDRIEGDQAVLEADGRQVLISASLIDKGAHEGDVLKRSGDRFEADFEATEERRMRILQLQKKLQK